MNISNITLSSINPAEYNPRVITKDEFEGLKQSLTTFGQQENLIVNKDMTLISGHQRLQAMLALGWEEATCNVVDLDKHEEKKLNVLMNSQAISGTWDDLKLAEILEELKLDDNYESLRLNALEPLDLSPTEVEEDEAPEVSQEPPVSKLGEIYQLGRHRVMCGDSTDKASVESLMNGVRADMVFTDPPYNINYSDMSGKFEKIKNDKMTHDDFRQFLIDALLTEADTYYVCCSWQYSQIFREALEKLGKPIKAFIVWNKVNPAQNLDKYYKAHEIILYSGKFGGEKTRRSDVWELKRQKNTDHPTMKPIELIGMAIDDTPTAKTIYDGFLGSGSTLIACEQTDRTCYGMELDPKYVDVIRKRYWKFINDGNEEGWIDGTTNSND